MMLKNYVCYSKDKFEMAQKGDHAAEYNVMKALSLKIIYTYNLLPRVIRGGLTRPATQAEGQATTHSNELSTNRARNTKTKP